MEIIIRGLSRNFGKKKALERVSVTIPSGIYGLLGPNGAGKTSLMRILATLLEPSDGEVIVNGVPIRETEKIREMTGYLPQEFSFYGNMSVYGALDYLGMLSCIPAKVCRERILTLLEQVNLRENARTREKALSEGMKRRLGIAQALLHDSEQSKAIREIVSTKKISHWKILLLRFTMSLLILILMISLFAGIMIWNNCTFPFALYVAETEASAAALGSMGFAAAAWSRSVVAGYLVSAGYFLLRGVCL